jgi:hypothetical protein
VRRKGFTLFSALSLLLCVGVCVLWVRSYSHGERVNGFFRESAYLQTPVWTFTLISGNGGFGVSEAHNSVYCADEAKWRRVLERNPARRGIFYGSLPAVVYPQWNPGESEWRWAGFQWTRTDRRAPNYWSIERSAVLPYWLPCLLAVVAPTMWFRARLVRSLQKRRGRCISCGYDLTGNASGTCPECGATIPTPNVAS